MLKIVLQYLATIAIVNADIEIIILPTTGIVEKEINSNTILTCEVKNAPQNARLAWFNNVGIEINRKQSNDSVVFIDDEGGKLSLLFKGIQNYHEGLYTCKLMNDDNKVLSEMSRLIKLQAKFEFVRAPTKQFLELGKDGLIVCEPNQGIIARITLAKDLKDVQIAERFEKVKDGFVIKNVKSSDAGSYICRMRTEDGISFVAVDIEVEVERFPVIVNQKYYHLGIEGANLSITCETRGDNIRYNFFINGHPLINSSSVVIDLTIGRVFYSPLSRNDKGQFTCSASNGVGQVNVTDTLVVQFPPLIWSFQNVTVKEGQSTMIECLFEGLPIPFVVITKIEGSQRIVENNRLSIDAATIADVGLYRCEINSVIGNDSSTAMVHVNVSPRPVPDQIYKWFSFALHTRNITCSVIAYPQPTFLWYFNDVQLETDNETFKRFNGEYESRLQIYIAVRDQYWIYNGRKISSHNFRGPAKITCKVNNSEGTINITMTFQRSTIPDILYDLAYDIYPCQINFNYTLPEYTGEEPIIGLVAYVNDTPRSLPLTDVLKIKKLQPQTTYIIRVACRNIVGNGEVNEEFEITTLSPSAPYPINITSAVYSSSNRTTTVFWDEPIDVCHPILSYKFNYRMVTLDLNMRIVSFSGDWITVNENNGSATSIKLENLKQDSSYQLEAFAKNSLGESKYIGQFIFKTTEKRAPISRKGNLSSGLFSIIIVISALLFS